MTQLVFKFIFTFLFISLSATIGCAEPNYTEEAAQQATKNQTSKCKLKMNTIDHCLSITWEKQPTSSEYGQFLFRVLDNKSNQPLELKAGESFSVILWMPSMGHGASPVLVETVSPGVFRAKNVFFTMPGEWEIRFKFQNGNQVIDEAILKLTR